MSHPNNKPSQAQDALDEVRHQLALVAEHNPGGWSRQQQRLKEQEAFLVECVRSEEAKISRGKPRTASHGQPAGRRLAVKNAERQL